MSSKSNLSDLFLCAKRCNATSGLTSQHNIPYISTREPGGIEIAEQIRSIILDIRNTAMTEETEALLYAASRMQHLKEKVLPALFCFKTIWFGKLFFIYRNK